jgi:hypothetical protein
MFSVERLISIFILSKGWCVIFLLCLCTQSRGGFRACQGCGRPCTWRLTSKAFLIPIYACVKRLL